MSPYRLTKVEAPTRLVLSFKEAFNRHNAAEIVSLWRETGTLEHFAPAPEGEKVEGKKNIRQFWISFFAKTPTIQLKIEDLVQAGARVHVLWRFSWENPQAGQEHLRGVSIFVVEQGAFSTMMSYVKGPM